MHGLARVLGYVVRLKFARGQRAGAQRPVLQRVDVEHKQPVRADEPPDLREHHTGHHIGKHVHGDVGHDRVEAPVGEGKPLGHVGHQEPGQLSGPGLRLPDGLGRQVDCRDRVALADQPGRVVAGSASQLQDGAHARLPERGQERPGPHACPVQVIAGLPALPEELIPELITCVGHMATLCRARSRTVPCSPRASGRLRNQDRAAAQPDATTGAPAPAPGPARG